MEEAIANYVPCPLIDEEQERFILDSNLGSDKKYLVCYSACKPYVKISEHGEEDNLNLATFGFLGYQYNESVIEKAIEELKRSGVSTCGPRGFYGTYDVHLELESRIAEFMGTQSAVIYASGYSTISSVIPAFLRSDDYLFVDKGVSFATQDGIQLVRSHRVYWFEHNDMDDLERLIKINEKNLCGNKRFFVIVEGLYAAYCDICKLPELLELKERFPFRIIIEESFSIGVLGRYGRGITEHYGLPADSVEIITASIGNSIGSLGGFTVGSKLVGQYQRLSANGYSFSCSTPPFLVVGTIQAIDLLERGNEIEVLQRKTVFLNQQLRIIIKSFVVVHTKESPIAHLRLHNSKYKDGVDERMKEERFMQSIVDQLRIRHKIIVVRPIYVSKEKFPPPPSIRITISAMHSESDIVRALELIEKVGSELIPAYTN